MDLKRWLASLETEGHESWGMIEMAFGVAILIGYSLHWALRNVSWLGTLTLLLLLVVGLLYGQRMEYRLFARLGRRRVRGTLLLRITWVTVGWCLLWALLLLGVAHARAWTRIPGWHTGPVLLMSILCSYYLTLGLVLRIRRWTFLGGVLLVWLILLPGLAALRSRLDIAVAVAVGLTMIAFGYLGYRAFERDRVAHTQPPVNMP